MTCVVDCSACSLAPTGFSSSVGRSGRYYSSVARERRVNGERLFRCAASPSLERLVGSSCVCGCARTCETMVTPAMAMDTRRDGAVSLAWGVRYRSPAAL